jgi:hypothetical protein
MNVALLALPAEEVIHFSLATSPNMARSRKCKLLCNAEEPGKKASKLCARRNGSRSPAKNPGMKSCFQPETECGGGKCADYNDQGSKPKVVSRLLK